MNMSLVIKGEEHLTTKEAKALAAELGEDIAMSTITAAVRRGVKGEESGIEGAIKLGDSAKSSWLIPRVKFVEWLESERKPGPKTS